MYFMLWVQNSNVFCKYILNFSTQYRPRCFIEDTSIYASLGTAHTTLYRCQDKVTQGVKFRITKAGCYPINQWYTKQCLIIFTNALPRSFVDYLYTEHSCPGSLNLHEEFELRRIPSEQQYKTVEVKLKILLAIINLQIETPESIGLFLVRWMRKWFHQ